VSYSLGHRHRDNPERPKIISLVIGIISGLLNSIRSNQRVVTRHSILDGPETPGVLLKGCLHRPSPSAVASQLQKLALNQCYIGMFQTQVYD